MSKKTKNFLLIFCFALFFVLGSFLVSYAYGYKFDFEGLTWVKTGGLAVKANIDGANVLINGKRAGQIPFFSNTFTKKNLLPESYSVIIEKQGLPAVLKNIEIVSGQVVQLVHIHLPKKEEIDSFIATRGEEKPIPYSIEKISDDPVLIKDFKLKKFGDSFYIVSNDSEAPGLFTLNSEGKWDQIYTRPLTDAVLSPDGKKVALVGKNEINVFWLKNESEAPYFRAGRSELILENGPDIEKVFWFKTDWHLIYLTANGETRFLEVDSTGGRNEILI